MARFIEVNGAITAQPGAYSKPVQSAGGVKVPYGANSVVCCIGECTGGAKPGTIYELFSDGLIHSLFQSGPLFDMVRTQFNNGVAKVIAVRVGEQTQGEGSFENGSSAALINLTSRDYGLEALKVSYKTEAGTDGAFGRKITLAKAGFSDEIGDNLGENCAAAIRYTGNGSASTLAIARTGLTTTVTGSSDGSAAFTMTFDSTTTVENMVAFVNSKTGFEAVLMGGEGKFLCQNLDFFAAVSILTETGTVSMNSATRTDFSSGSITGLDDADIVQISKAGQSNEYLYTTSASTPEFVRGYNGSLAQEWTSASAVTFVAVTCVNQKVIDWVNGQSSRLTASRNTGYSNGFPIVPTSATYLTGATSPAVTSTDYQNALNAVKTEYYRFGVIDSTDTSIHQLVKTHIQYRWGVGRMFGSWDVGATKDEAESVIRGRAKTLNIQDVTLHFQDSNVPNKDGVDTNYAPWMTAAIVASLRAASPVGQPLQTRVLPNVSALDQGFTLTTDAIERLLRDGVCVCHYERGQYRVLRGLATYTSDDNLENIDSQVRSVVGWVQYQTKVALQEKFIGKKALGSASSLKGIVADAMDIIRDEDKAIVRGRKQVNGEIVTIPAYEITTVTTNGNVTSYTNKFTPVVPQDFAQAQPVVVQYTDTL